MMGNIVQVLVNGKPVDSIATSDRGLLYGDGVFETIAVSGGQVCYWGRHLQRLQFGCERLGMETIDEALLLRECTLLIEQSQQAVIKIIITRGTGGRGYRPPLQPRLTRIIQLHDWPDYPVSLAESGIKLIVCETRLGQNSTLAGIKHLNRLEQVLARQEWDDPAIMEGLMLDTEGNIVEGTMSNVFMVRNAKLMTPDLQHCGVAGIVRARVLEMAAERSIEVRIQHIGLDSLLQADEVFICNSLIGIWPVIGIDQHTFQKGPVTMQLQDLLANECAVA